VPEPLDEQREQQRDQRCTDGGESDRHRRFLKDVASLMRLPVAEKPRRPGGSYSL
jgi:hypothetical protein